LRLEKPVADERLVPSRIHETMKWQLSLSTMADLDAEALAYLQMAYEVNI